MKKKRGLFVILAGVVLLCVLIVCYFALLKANSSEEETTEEETTQEEVAAIASDDISTLTFEAGDQTVTFQKAEDSWTLEGQEDFPVDASKVDSVVSCLASVKADRTLTDVEDPGEYGLDVPTNVIEVVKTDGSSEKITVGDKNSSTGNTYICLNDDVLQPCIRPVRILEALFQAACTIMQKVRVIQPSHLQRSARLL